MLAEQRRRFLPEVREFITTTVTERERKSNKLQWPGLCSFPGARHPLSMPPSVFTVKELPKRRARSS